MLAVDRESSLQVVHFDDEFAGLPETEAAEEIFARFLSEHIALPKASSAKKDPWLVVACRADYQRSTFQTLNHFVPAFTRAQLGEEAFAMVTDAALKKVDKQLEKSWRRMCADSSSSDEWGESLKEHIQRLQQKKEFLQMMHQMSLHAGEVPADGNCALWSVLSLIDGPIVQAQSSTKGDVDKLRNDPCQVSIARICFF